MSMSKRVYKKCLCFLVLISDSSSAAKEAVEAYVLEGLIRFGFFVLGYLLAQGWNWAQRTLGKWAHYTLDTGK